MKFLLVHEENVKKFYYWENEICQGIQHANEFYRYVASVVEEKHLEAYKLSDELLEAGSSVCLTVSPNRYSVWQSLSL